jgi:DNA-binding NarL/FixJ family response regulator
MPLDRAMDYALAPAEPVGAPSSQPVPRATTAQPTLLSRREREVAALIAQGHTNREIGEQLFISEWTVETHVRHILTKLDYRSRAQVAAWATEQGLLSPSAP